MSTKLVLKEGFITDDLSLLVESKCKKNATPEKKWKEWFAKVVPNPKNKFGKDFTFMNKGNILDCIWGVLGILNEGDLIEYCKSEPISNKYRSETRFTARVIEITEEYLVIEII
jgi:hypothetical protein